MRSQTKLHQLIPHLQTDESVGVEEWVKLRPNMKEIKASVDIARVHCHRLFPSRKSEEGKNWMKNSILMGNVCWQRNQELATNIHAGRGYTCRQYLSTLKHKLAQNVHTSRACPDVDVPIHFVFHVNESPLALTHEFKR